MKKIAKVSLAVIVLSLLVFCSVACNTTFVTSVPPYNEVMNNLEGVGYTVEVETFSNYYTKTKLEATRGEEYLVLYWVTDQTYCDFAESEIRKNYNGVISTIEGNFTDNVVVCGTDKAINDAKLGTFSFN